MTGNSEESGKVLRVLSYLRNSLCNLYSLGNIHRRPYLYDKLIDRDFITELLPNERNMFQIKVAELKPIHCYLLTK